MYFVFANNDTSNKNLVSLDWIRFEGGKEVMKKPAEKKKENQEIKAGVALKKGVPPQSESPSNPVRKPPIPGKQQAAVSSSQGMALMNKSDCKACHSMNQKMVGPAFLDIAKRYKNDRAALSKLTGKVINGGAGNWGQIPMTPHSQLSQKDAAEMVRYILSLKK